MDNALSPHAMAGAVTRDWSIDAAPATPRASVSGHETTIVHPASHSQPSSVELEALERVPPALRQRFRNIQFLGKGGMGVVYRAHDEQLDRDVAIKFINGGGASRALREARAQARVLHENVCKIFDVGVADGQPYITMQLVRGQPLHLASADMSLAEQVRVVRDVAAALHEAHRLGLVHRDVKPGNILVECDGDGQRKPYVMDFGLARVAGDAGDTATGAIAGTLAYMAPEQARGDIKALDRRTDVYALGATLYELLTGRPPFVESEAWKVLLKLEHDAPPAVRSVRPGVPADLDTIVQRCLEREPARRYDSARALAEDLQRYLDGDPILARPTTVLYRLGRRVRRHKLVASLVASLVVAFGVFIGFTVHARGLAAREAELARSLGEGVKEMQLFMRYAASLPSHDISRERDIIRARIAELAAEVPGSASPGPLHAAIGHGYLTLQEPEGALHHLRLAEATDPSPDLHYAMGRALVDIYRAETDKLARILDGNVREARKAELAALYRDPALIHLRAADGARLEHPDLLAGLIALVEERHADALRLASQAEAAAPWFYEATMLIAETHWAIGRQHKHDTIFDYPRMMASTEPALAAYRRAAAIGRSDPRIHTWACGVFTQALYADIKQGVDIEPRFRDGEAACDLALAADPLGKQSQIHLAWFHHAYVGSLACSLKDGVTTQLDESIERIEELAGRYPDDPLVHWLVGAAGMSQVAVLRAQQLDEEPAMTRAIAGYERSLALDPNFSWSARELVSLFMGAAMGADRRGADPFPLLARAEQHLGHAEKIWPDAPLVKFSRCSFHLIRAQMRLGHGLDPSAELRDGRRSCLDLRAQSPNEKASTIWLLHLASFEAELRIATGEDTTGALAEIEALLAQLPTPVDPNHVQLAHDVRARAAFARGESPEPYIERALAAYGAHLEAAPALHKHNHSEAELLLIRVRDSMRRGAVDPALFDEVIAGFSVDITPGRADVERAHDLATIHQLRAAWSLSRGEDPAKDLEIGLAHAAEALDVNPRMPTALAVKGALHLVAARAAETPALRREAAEQAVASLSEALRGNVYLTREFEPVLGEARRLVAASIP
jgi:tetratricopeptide (TPR) repeat protein/predicted Ser/Thr protein kinase